MLVEVCANSLESALVAEQVGADRIELCTELSIGGLTPSYGLLQLVREKIRIPVRVLIRPRGGHFTYTEHEFETMLRDISYCRSLGFEGVVSGCLKADKSLDIDHISQMISAGGDMAFTFHRAFDWVLDPIKAYKQLSELGVDTILTSGQHPRAIEGMELLVDLLKLEGHSEIMPGSGINATNAFQFKQKGFPAIHLSATRHIERSDFHSGLPMESPDLLEKNTWLRSDAALLTAVLNLVK